MSGLIASVSTNVKVWEFEPTSKEVIPVSSSTSQNPFPIASVCWNHTNHVVAIGGDSPQVHLIEARSGKLLSTVPFEEKDMVPGQSISALSFSSNSRTLAYGAANSLYLWVQQ